MNGCYMVYHIKTRSVMSMIIKLQIMFSSFYNLQYHTSYNFANL